MTTKDECIRMGGEWVTTYKRYDGKLVRPFCRKIGRKKDRNGNTSDKWKREKGNMFDMTEYNIDGGEIEGVIKKDNRNGKVKWWVSIDGRHVDEGEAKSISEAKSKASDSLRRR
jgi:hypothetical protein